MHRSLMMLALAGLLSIAACGEGNLTFPGAEGSDESGATAAESTPTPEPDSGATPSPTPQTTRTPGNPPSLCVPDLQPCDLQGTVPCCSGLPCIGVCPPGA